VVLGTDVVRSGLPLHMESARGVACCVPGGGSMDTGP
jgi:hypothetical protein